MASNRINILSEDIANKIAAGEVVERPASVVKELVENAIDAESTRIFVDVEVGGRKRVRVTDNGTGMTPDDAVNAFQRHATSKLKTADDLNQIFTLGFRGEALPSIASVSKVELLTRPADTETGTRVVIDGGKILEVTPTGCPVGTQIDIERLFFNTPARYKFLKTTSTEMRHIMAAVTRPAIAYPQIAFRLTHDGRTTFDYPKATDLLSRLRDVFGGDIAENLIPVENTIQGVRLSGFAGNMNITRKNKDYQYIFINKRYVRDAAITRAIYDGYGSVLIKERHPVAILFLEIDPVLIDVNVHPTKEEVRFSDNQTIYRVVYHAIKTAFTIENTPEHIPSVFQQEKPSSQSIAPSETKDPTPPSKTWNFPPTKRDYTPSKKEVETALSAYDMTSIPSKEDAVDDPINIEQDDFRVIGQLHRCYILVENQTGLWIIDQHVAHERILYDQAIAADQGKTFPSQQLLFSFRLDLSAAEAALYQKNKTLFANLGFVIKELAGRTIVVEGVPSSIREWKDGQAFRDLLDTSSDEYDPQTISDEREWMIDQYSCKHAIKKGDLLNLTEMTSLVRRLFKTENPYTCPHHRPIILEMSISELNQKFGRPA